LVPGPADAEAGYMLAREGGPRAEAQFPTSLANRRCRRWNPPSKDHRRSTALVLTYVDLPLGTADAAVIALDERLRLTEGAT
jgi:hypothetical protein